MKKILFFAFLCFSFVVEVFAQNPAGNFKGFWNGEIVAGGQSIKMEFEISEQDGVANGKMSAQGVKGLPVGVSVDGAALTVESQQLGMSIKGILMGGKIMGTFSQRGFETGIILLPGKIERKRPQTPKGELPYEVEEVVFENMAEEATLSGTLTYPVGYGSMRPKNVPVVVMVTGSGLQNRDEEIFEHKPFAVIADWLARNGIASLRYDDRGTGNSVGPMDFITSENNAADAKAVVEYVRSLKKFGKVGVLGHSEGGTIALMLAGEQVPDFIVSMAGVATSGMDCIIWQNLAQMELQGIPEQMRSNYGKALRGIYKERIKLFKENRADSTKSRGGAIPLPDKFIQDLCINEGISLPQPFIANLVAVASTKSVWLDWFVGYSPRETVGKIKCPVMAINGELDMQVPADANLQVLENLLPGNKRNLIKGYPGKNHLFQNCTKTNSLQYEEIEETISQDVLEDIAGWIRELK